MPVQPQHRIDEARLAAWLSAHVPGFQRPLRLEQFRGGQSNPTYLVTASAQRYVLRKKPPGMLGRLGGIDVEALGIPSMESYAEAYCRRSGRESIEHFDYYQAFGLFRIAAVHQGIVKRIEDGSVSSPEARAVARPAYLAELGWQQVERILARRA